MQKGLMMEFLRFGSKIPGSYWGCCAVCIIQDFKQDPDEKASIQLVSGDSGMPITKDRERLYAGPTWGDIFKTRIRIGTMSSTEMPNHTFFAVLADNQIYGETGKKWLKILRENGFEFVRSVDNSVYTGSKVPKDGKPVGGSHINHIFALFRNIGNGAIRDPFTPPKGWTDLPSVKPEANDLILASGEGIGTAFSQGQRDADLTIWQEGKTVLLKEADLVKAGAPITLAGIVGRLPATKEGREREDAMIAEAAALKAKAAATPKPSAFPTAAPPPPPAPAMTACAA